MILLTFLGCAQLFFPGEQWNCADHDGIAIRGTSMSVHINESKDPTSCEVYAADFSDSYRGEISLRRKDDPKIAPNVPGRVVCDPAYVELSSTGKTVYITWEEGFAPTHITYNDGQIDLSIISVGRGIFTLNENSYDKSSVDLVCDNCTVSGSIADNTAHDFSLDLRQVSSANLCLSGDVSGTIKSDGPIILGGDERSLAGIDTPPGTEIVWMDNCPLQDAMPEDIP